MGNFSTIHERASALAGLAARGLVDYSVGLSRSQHMTPQQFQRYVTSLDPPLSRERTASVTRYERVRFGRRKGQLKKVVDELPLHPGLVRPHLAAEVADDAAGQLSESTAAKCIQYQRETGLPWEEVLERYERGEIPPTSAVEPDEDIVSPALAKAALDMVRRNPALSYEDALKQILG